MEETEGRMPWMIKLYRRCERCKGEGTVPDIVRESAVESETTPGGRCPSCSGRRYTDSKLLPAEELDAFLAEDRTHPRDDETG
jgi:hypothetical protein